MTEKALPGIPAGLTLVAPLTTAYTRRALTGPDSNPQSCAGIAARLLLWDDPRGGVHPLV